MQIRHKARRHSYDTASRPPGFNVPDADWSALPVEMRRETLRMCDEIGAGIAIEKDRICGRGKYDPKGFYGLHYAEAESRRLDSKADASNGERAKARDNVSALRQMLADDEARVALNEAILAEFGPFAEAQGLTLVQWIQRSVDIERECAEDLVGGLFKICEIIGCDPLKLFGQVLASEQVASR